MIAKNIKFIAANFKMGPYGGPAYCQVCYKLKQAGTNLLEHHYIETDAAKTPLLFATDGYIALK
jgi:hypothetical protein